MLLLAQDDFEDGLQGFEAFKMPDWVVERQQLLMEVDELRQHKDWADRRIDALLKRATGAERPQIAETNRLREEVTRLRQVSRSGQSSALTSMLQKACVKVQCGSKMCGVQFHHDMGPFVSKH